jgi:NADPH:quinone reductase
MLWHDAPMLAVVITEHSGPGSLTIADVAPPTGDHELGGPAVTVDVRAAGVSFPELLQTRGLYQHSPDLPFVPGLEAAGLIREAPADSGFRPGDRVMAFTNTGGQAEIAKAPTAMTFALPDEMDFAEGAATILNLHTAYFAITTRARMQSGDVIVVHGAAGGLGTAIVSIAAALGATAIAVVSTDAKADVARAAGAHHIVRADESWANSVRGIAPAGVDIVFDPVGGDRTTDSLRILRRLGRYVVLGFTAGEIPQVRVNRLLLNNLDVVGAGWGAYVRSDPMAFRAIGEAVGELLAQGVRPVVGHRIPFDDAVSAYELLEQRRALGKVVLEMR